MADLTDDEARDLADEILQRDEFLPAGEPGIAAQVLQRITEAIGDALAWLFSGFGGLGGGAGTLLATILLVAAGALLLFAIYRAFLNRNPRAKEEKSTGTRVVFDEIVEPEALRAQLAELKSAADWRGAVVAGFRLAVVGLIDQNIAREVAGATTGDFSRAVHARRPELSEQYSPAAAAFERAFYSDLDVDQNDLADVEALLNRLQMAGTR